MVERGEWVRLMFESGLFDQRCNQDNIRAVEGGGVGGGGLQGFEVCDGDWEEQAG